MNKTLGELQKQAITELSAYSDSARLDVDLIICHVLSISRTALITQDRMVLEPEQLNQIQQLIEKRKQSYPVAYIIGSRHFWDLELKVTEDTLIPRPETELLVEMALSLFAEDQTTRVLDLGTGSGAVAIAIAKARPEWSIIACDNSPAALSVAKQNAETYQLENIKLINSDWFDDIPDQQKFDLLLSNPPYIESDDPHLKQGDVQHEPQAALSSGRDGLDDIRKLIANAKCFLHAHGWLWLEHGFDQAQNVKDIFTEHNYTNIKQHLDLFGHTRISGGQLG
ncbi:Peptide chain release factor N(5)-glutamine methyltransferase [hydrothermal vent metagenome]|uniref:peptide chain release factor N(5)-glutamine methyltransferase n=1 Tax=hydrothermal vent metagenome TaxID=652676 RepID=A0A3B1A1A1_9ZZZZ